MDVIEYNNKIYYKNDQGSLFLYEPLWDTFRPFDIRNPKYKGELFDKNYGFGSEEMKRYCNLISTDFESKKIITNPLFFYRWSNQEVVWNKDRITLQCEWNFIKKKTFRKSPNNIKRKTLRNAY